MAKISTKKLVLMFFGLLLAFQMPVRAESQKQAAAPIPHELLDDTYLQGIITECRVSELEGIKAQWHNPAFAKKKQMLINYMQNNWKDINVNISYRIIEIDPSALIPLFVPVVKQYFIETPNDVLRLMEEHNPELRSVFIEAAQKAASVVAQDLEHVDFSVIEKIQNYHPEAIRQASIQHAHAITKVTVDNCAFARRLVFINPSLASYFTPLVIQNFSEIKSGINDIRDFWWCGLGYILMRHSAKAIDAFTAMIGDDIDQHMDLINVILSESDNKAPHFTAIVVRNHAQIAARLRSTKEQITYMRLLAELVNQDAAAFDQFKALVQDPKWLRICDERGCTQSTMHMYKNKDRLQASAVILHLCCPQEASLVADSLQKEEELTDAGYATFYHAQASAKFIPIKLDTLLYTIRTAHNTYNFLFLHTKQDPVFHAVRDAAQEGLPVDDIRSMMLENERTRREYLLQGSRNENYEYDRSHYLFLNDSICGNYTNQGSNSFPTYFMSNTNIGNFDHLIKNDIKTIFDNHGYGHLAPEFIAELEHLQAEYLELSKCGTLYLIGVPKDTVHLSVIPARSGGYIQPLKVDGQTTTDMRKIAAALLTDSYVEPADQKEYVATMTHDEHGWLNPASGIKVFPMIIATSEEKRVEFESKWKSFETRLRERIVRTN